MYPQLASLRPTVDSSCSLPPIPVLHPTHLLLPPTPGHLLPTTYLLPPTPVLPSVLVLQPTNLLLPPTPGHLPPTTYLLPPTPVLPSVLVLQPTNLLPPTPGHLPSPLTLIQLSLTLLPLSPLTKASPRTNQVTALLPYASEEQKEARR